MHDIVQTVFSFDSSIYSYTAIISEVCVTLALSEKYSIIALKSRQNKNPSDL